MDNFCCYTSTMPTKHGCGPEIKLPYGIESIKVMPKSDGIFCYYEVTIKYYRCEPLTERYTNIEDFYKKHNIIFNAIP